MLAPNPLGTPFIELHSVESTNNYAMGLVHEGMAQHGTAVFAHDQFKGKGQRSKEWKSEPGKNMALTVIIQPLTLNLSQSFLLSMTVAVAVYKVFCNKGGNETKIKWPNDIYWRDRKAGGILIENVVQGTEWKFAICGIGLNINQVEFGELTGKAVSLKQITGKDLAPVEVAKDICAELDNQYNCLLQFPSIIIEQYKRNLYKLNETVKLKKGNRIFEATVKDVTTNGELIVQHAVEEKFSVGEVEWMIGN